MFNNDFIANLLASLQWKNFENRLAFGEDIYGQKSSVLVFGSHVFRWNENITSFKADSSASDDTSCSPHTAKISVYPCTDILWRVFHILTELVPYTFVSINGPTLQCGFIIFLVFTNFSPVIQLCWILCLSFVRFRDHHLKYFYLCRLKPCLHNATNRARQLYKNISMLFLFPVKDGKLSTGVNATFDASCYG